MFKFIPGLVICSLSLFLFSASAAVTKSGISPINYLKESMSSFMNVEIGYGRGTVSRSEMLSILNTIKKQGNSQAVALAMVGLGALAIQPSSPELRMNLTKLIANFNSTPNNGDRAVELWALGITLKKSYLSDTKVISEIARKIIADSTNANFASSMSELGSLADHSSLALSPATVLKIYKTIASSTPTSSAMANNLGAIATLALDDGAVTSTQVNTLLQQVHNHGHSEIFVNKLNSLQAFVTQLSKTKIPAKIGESEINKIIAGINRTFPPKVVSGTRNFVETSFFPSTTSSTTTKNLSNAKNSQASSSSTYLRSVKQE
jgi:hypothetical protein